MERHTQAKKIGRPILKTNRTKIGLSISGATNDILSDLAKRTGKNKSSIFEDAIRIMKEREDIMYARAKTIEQFGDDAFLDFAEYMKNRTALKNEEGVRHVG
jgi:predicted DNA-binding protein